MLTVRRNRITGGALKVHQFGWLGACNCRSILLRCDVLYNFHPVYSDVFYPLPFVRDLIWFQDKLQSLAGQHADVLESLSPNVRKRVEFLREIQVDLRLFPNPFLYFHTNLVPTFFTDVTRNIIWTWCGMQVLMCYDFSVLACFRCIAFIGCIEKCSADS